MHRDGVREGIPGIRPPFLEAIDRIATNLGLVGIEQPVMKRMELLGRHGTTTSQLPRQRGVGEDAASHHHMPRRRICREQRLQVLRRKDVPVVGHWEGRPGKGLAIGLPARRALVEVLAHARVNDELGERVAQ